MERWNLENRIHGCHHPDKVEVQTVLAREREWVSDSLRYRGFKCRVYLHEFMQKKFHLETFASGALGASRKSEDNRPVAGVSRRVTSPFTRQAK